MIQVLQHRTGCSGWRCLWSTARQCVMMCKAFSTQLLHPFCCSCRKASVWGHFQGKTFLLSFLLGQWVTDHSTNHSWHGRSHDRDACNAWKGWASAQAFWAWAWRRLCWHPQHLGLVLITPSTCFPEGISWLLRALCHAWGRCYCILPKICTWIELPAAITAFAVVATCTCHWYNLSW